MVQTGKPDNKTILGIVIFLIFAAVVIYALFSGRNTVTATHAPVKITVLKVGKADAIIMQAGAESLVLDAGEEDDGEEVLEYLVRQGIERVDTLIEIRQ